MKYLNLKPAVAALAILSGLTGATQAQNLFDGSVSSRAAGQLEGTIRSRMVSVNKSVLASAFAESDKKPANISIELFPGRTVNLQSTDLDRQSSDGTVSWSGTVVGAKHSSATLVVRDDRVVGQIQIGTEIFRITPRGNGAHAISQVRPEQFREDIVIRPQGSLRPAPLRTPVPSAATPRINVLVLFTETAKTQALAASTTIQDDVLLAVALANTAYTNTLMKSFKLRKAGLRNIGCNYDESVGSYSQILYDVTNASTCIGARAATLRNQFNADLVAVMRGNGSYCGVAWLNSNPSGASAYGFSVTSRNCVTNHSFAHEIGHNLGLNHDRHVSSGPQTDSNFGYVALANQIRSVMAYNTLCSSNGVYCSRLPHFSNTRLRGWPIQSGNRVRFGRTLAWPDPADNRTKLMQNWAAVSNWR